MKLLLLTPVFLLALTHQAADLVFAPEAGTTLTKTFRQDFEVELIDQELVFTINGEEQPEPDGGEFELVLKEHETITITDEYIAVEGGRATQLRRTYDELTTLSTQEISGPEIESDAEPEKGESELEGTTVLFQWSEDDEEYAVEFSGDDEGDEELLEDLDADADLTWFLPDDEVDVGDSWELEASVFALLSSPGGDSKVERPGDDDTEDAFGEQFDENLSGDVTCTLSEIEEGVAVIRIEMELETTVEEEDDMGGEEADVTSTSTYSFTFELEGELRWNVEANHADGLSLSGDAGLELVNEQEGSSQNVDFEVRSVQTFEGSLSFEFETE
ncbi:MAG: hypothetical protein GY711_20485 [bacterium]|nr:hypothetical protein [bacterium]